MKFVCAVVLFSAAIMGVNAVDWQSLKRTVKLPKEHYAGVPDGRITNGHNAGRTQFPYQAFLRVYNEGHFVFCGGTLISNRWIVTAAHCTVDMAKGVDVYLGAWDISDHHEKGQQIIFVETRNVIVHEHYFLYSDDISLIKLPVPIDFNEYVQPAKLPAKKNNPDDYLNREAIASGWGKTSDSATGVTDILQYIEVPVISNYACLRWFIGYVLTSHICVRTTGGTATCSGDSGGPLVLADGSHTLIGVTSFGGFECEAGVPAVFTRITSYLNWIEKHTGVV